MTRGLLKELSQRNVFHSERNWLMYRKSAAETFNIFSEESINVDAEVAIAVRVDEK